MESIKLFDQACAIILTKLEEKYPFPIEISDWEMGFYERHDISKERDKKALILDDAFKHLKGIGYLEYSSSDSRIPRTDLKITTNGLVRLRKTDDGLPDKKATLAEQLKVALSNVSEKGTDTVSKEVFKQFANMLIG